ncbi:TolC family protein [Mucilaginibacter gotjawali]|uniref:Outer membrane protein n=2 Tax=Mucilaginibacter gotjawali TaxID=1550579 RepID=A0A839S7N8_9SPHI|nr:TolC family protein [Mucilaginibacter gotjawali]MBB3054131.1 outer membrane protein [Mucilaginibacter gotjawali]BAU54400.1 outer membrane channel protein [Mucilaginibacter gotjawali]
MRFSKYYLTLLFLAGGVLAHAQQDTVITLQQCLEIAIKNNLSVKQASVTAEQAHIGLNQAKENLIPYISGGANRNLTSGRALNPVTNAYITQSVTSDNYNLSGNVTVFNGLALQNAIKQASLAYQSGKMAYQAAKDLVTVNVITNYLMVLDAKELLKQNESQLAVAKENLDIAATKENYGANTTASTFSDLKGAYAGSKVNVVQGQNSLDAAKLSLYQLMNIPYNKNVQLQPLTAEDLVGDKDVNAEQVYETALQQLATVKAATLMRQSAEKGVQYARGLLYPSLFLAGGIGTNYSNLNTQSYYSQFRNNYGTDIEIGLNIPIFTNHVKKNAVALAKLNLLNYEYIEEGTKVQVKQSVETAWSNMLAAYNRYSALQDEANAYAESYRVQKIRFDAGVITSDLFLIAKGNMDAAELNLIAARYDYIIYSKILDYYQGKLTQ